MVVQLFSCANEDPGLVVSLEKPLGIVLEELEEGKAKGVKVTGIREDGSAFKSQFKDSFVGLKLVSVMGEKVDNMVFDDVMTTIINAASPVLLTFQGSSEIDDPPTLEGFSIGSPVSIVVLDGENEKVIDTKVGENLRAVLLDNNVEVYKGLKKKLGNCGGAGQCTFCAVEFVNSIGWAERSDYEDTKLKKQPTARLSCLNNIQGPATVRIS